MSFKEVASLDADVTVALGKKDKSTGKPYPKQAEGYYLGNRSVDNKRGESKLHFLQTSSGNLGVWGTTDLNRKLGAVPVGTMVRITSTGTKPTPNGDMYTYRVEQDTDNTIDVSFSATTAQQESYDDSDAEEESNDEAGSDYNDNADTDAYLAAAKRKSEVEALLKGKSKVKN